MILSLNYARDEVFACNRIQFIYGPILKRYRPNCILPVIQASISMIFLDTKRNLDYPKTSFFIIILQSEKLIDIDINMVLFWSTNSPKFYWL